MRLEGCSILITGAGSGIGRATAVALARKGADLTLMGRRPGPLEETAKLVAAAGSRVRILAGDVRKETARQAAIYCALSQHGRLNVLINNAGNVRAGRLENIDPDDIQAIIDVNLLAPMLLTRAALSELRVSGQAAVVNVTSGIALIGVPFYTAYAAAKAGLARFGEALRRELLGENVHVMTVYPGATDTPMMATSRAGPDLGFHREPPEAVAQAIVLGLEQGDVEVIRGGEMRTALISANRDRPIEVDQRFLKMKPNLEAAVRDHRSL